MALKKAQEREYAKVLFLSENITHRDLALRVGVTEKTIGNWVEQGEWKKLKRSTLTTRQNQLNFLYDQLDWINTEISMRDIRVADIKEADIIIKLTAAIQKLEIETSVGETVEVARKFLEIVRGHDLELAKKCTVYFDILIQTMMK